MKQISAKHLAHNRNQRRDQHRQDQRHVQPQQQCPPEPTQLLIQKEPHLHSQLSMKHLTIKKNRWHNQRYPDRRTKSVLFCHCYMYLHFSNSKDIFRLPGYRYPRTSFWSSMDSLSQKCLLNIFSNKLFFKNVYGFSKVQFSF